jgi:hypothetical protein
VFLSTAVRERDPSPIRVWSHQVPHACGMRAPLMPHDHRFPCHRLTCLQLLLASIVCAQPAVRAASRSSTALLMPLALSRVVCCSHLLLPLLSLASLLHCLGHVRVSLPNCSVDRSLTLPVSPLVSPQPASAFRRVAPVLGLIQRTSCACMMAHGFFIMVRLLRLCLEARIRWTKCGCVTSIPTRCQVAACTCSVTSGDEGRVPFQ